MPFPWAYFEWIDSALESRANRCGDAKGEVAACTGADTSTTARRNGASGRQWIVKGGGEWAVSQINKCGLWLNVFCVRWLLTM